jgi:hypothetical protein
MELFVSEPHRPEDVALHELRACHTMVLIIGFKAGSLVRDHPGLTYTAAEFDLARELKIPVFAFLKTDGGRWKK